MTLYEQPNPERITGGHGRRRLRAGSSVTAFEPITLEQYRRVDTRQQVVSDVPIHTKEIRMSEDQEPTGEDAATAGEASATVEDGTATATAEVEAEPEVEGDEPTGGEG